MQNVFSQIEFLTNATSLIQNQIKHNTYTQYTYIRIYLDSSLKPCCWCSYMYSVFWCVLNNLLSSDGFPRARALLNVNKKKDKCNISFFFAQLQVTFQLHVNSFVKSAYVLPRQRERFKDKMVSRCYQRLFTAPPQDKRSTANCRVSFLAK